jgi:hypothetical protein
MLNLVILKILLLPFMSQMDTMSNFSEDTVRGAAEIREWLIRQISDKQEEIEKLRNTLFLVDMLLKQSSFRKASALGSRGMTFLPPQSSDNRFHQISSNSSENEAQPTSDKEITNVTAVAEAVPSTEEQHGIKEYVEVRPLKRLKDNLLLANAKLSQSSIQIIPAEGINLNVNTPPFKSFFLNRILDGMKSKDVEKSSLGQIKESESLNYEVEDNNGLITKIIINNYREKERLSEIFNTSTWVFTRMIEKSTRQ